MLREEMKNIKSTTKDLRSFGLVIAGFLAILGAISLWRDGSLYPLLFSIAGVFLALALTVPGILKNLFVPWMMFATVLGFVMTRVILTLLYYGLITPMSVTMRLFGKRFLDEKLEPEKESYWIKREDRTISKTSLENQF